MGHKPAPRNLPAPAAAPVCDLSPLDLHAVMIAAKPAKKVRDRLTPGMAQPVDVTLRLTGYVNVGEDSTAPVVKKPDLERVLKVAYAGFGKPNRARLMEAIVGGYAQVDESELPADAVEMAKTTVALLTTSSDEPRNGNVTGSIVVNLVRRGTASRK